MKENVSELHQDGEDGSSILSLVVLDRDIVIFHTQLFIGTSLAFTEIPELASLGLFFKC